LGIILAVVCEKVFSETLVKNVSISAMDAFVIGRAKLMIPPVEVPTIRSNMFLIGKLSSPTAS